MVIEKSVTGPDIQPVQLKRRTRRSPGPRHHYIAKGVAALALAALFLVLGSRLLTPSPLRMNAWVPATFLCGVMGLYLLVGGLRRRRQLSIQASAGKAFHVRPWAFDHPWNAREGRDDSVRQIGLTGATLALNAIGACYFLTQGGTDGPFVETLVALISLGCCGLGLGGWVVRRALERRRSGGAKLRFAGFPFFLGYGLVARFEPGWGDRPIDVLRATLRCVQERPGSETERFSTDRGTVCWQLYADTVVYHHLGAPRDGRGVPVTFTLPPRPDRANDLLSDYVRYWEIEVQATSGGRSYQGRFFVPVYARVETEAEAPAPGVMMLQPQVVTAAKAGGRREPPRRRNGRPTAPPPEPVAADRAEGHAAPPTAGARPAASRSERKSDLVLVR